MYNVLTDIGFNEDELFSVEAEGAQNNETFWRKQFTDAYLWLYPSCGNDIDKIKTTIEIEIIPNPVINHIYIDERKFDKIDILEIIDIRGRRIMKPSIGNNGRVDVKELTSGSFILILNQKRLIISGSLLRYNRLVEQEKD